MSIEESLLSRHLQWRRGNQSHMVKQGIPPCHGNRGVGVSKRKTSGLMGLNFLYLPFPFVGASRNPNMMTCVTPNCSISKHGKGPSARVSL